MERVRSRGLLLVVIALVAVNLRAVLTSVPPVVLDIQETTGWSDVTLGLLTTLPVVAMGAFALAVPAISAVVGRSHTIALAVALLAVAAGLRLIGDILPAMLVSVVLAGVGIALGAGLLPGVVREQLPDSVGLATGTWTGAMFTGAGVGAAITVPLAVLTGSWQVALALWALPAIIGLIAWTLAERGAESPARVRPLSLRTLPWRSRPAWALTGYMTVNSIIYYGSLAWVAPSLEERGWSAEAAGLVFGLFVVMSIPAAFILPAWTQRARSRRGIVMGISVVSSITLLVIGVTAGPLIIPALLVFGFLHSGGFTISLAMLSEYSSDSAAAARLTAMGFTVTYLVAALTPTLAGALIEATGSWLAVFTALAAVSLAQVPCVVPLRRGLTIA